MSGPGPGRPPSLRVALVCPYSLSRPGGVQGQVVGLARALSHRGHHATVFAPLDDPADAPADVELVVAGHSVALPANGSRAPVSVSPRAAARAVAAVRRGGYDVVHVHEPFAPGLPYGLLTGRGLPPLVGTFHRSGGSALYTALGPVVRRLARRLAVRCAVSEAARATAAAATGGEYTVLFNGVELDRYAGAEPWPTTGPTVLFLGRHEERKGLRVLLGAVDGPAAPGGAPVPTVWVAGDGPETEALRRRHPESDRLRWLGVVPEEEKVRRLAAADVLCAPSLGGESFGVILLEAMAARTLVVASDIDGYRAAAGDDAVLVPPGDAGALATALAEALVVPDRADRLARGEARARRWSMDTLAQAYEGVYDRVVVGAGR